MPTFLKTAWFLQRTVLKTLKKYLGPKYVEPALNHEMVRAVLTERQTSDCDVKCRISFITKAFIVVGCGIQNIR